MAPVSRPADGSVDVHLLLIPDADPVSGQVLEEDGTTTDFEGYMELIATLERLVGHDRPTI